MQVRGVGSQLQGRIIHYDYFVFMLLVCLELLFTIIFPSSEKLVRYNLQHFVHTITDLIGQL